MGEAAVTVGRRLGYTNAGTVEFILAPDGQFYFLEVNTRLQVEHPVTELVTGLDLVRWQILVAEGRSLPLTQEEVTFSGHAVEARVYAEDPAQASFPRQARWRSGARRTIMACAWMLASATGDAISIYYDPMVAKISAHGANRMRRCAAWSVRLGKRSSSACATTSLFCAVSCCIRRSSLARRTRRFSSATRRIWKSLRGG